MKDAMKNARKSAGLTRAKLAAAAGIHLQTLLAWENGKTSPTIPLAAQVCDVLGISIDEYIGHEPRRKK